MEPAGPARVERRLAAILAADVAGYSRLIEADEEGTLGRLKALRSELIDPKIALHRGRLDLAFEDMGEQTLKNIARPVRAYRLRAAYPRLAANAAGSPLSRIAGEGAERQRREAGEGSSPPLPLPDKPSIAVLPFQNMSGDPEQEYFADGMVEEIITALSRIRWLFVIARNSTFTYKGKAVDVKQVARELGVRYVLEGSVRKGGNRMRITGQLIDTASGAHIWANRFDGALDDIFELQDQVASGVVGAIEPRLYRAEIERATRKP